jgi:hypothetical protein
MSEYFPNFTERDLNERLGYDFLKAWAKASKRPVTDFTALHTKNDPFYMGTPGAWASGKWFAGLWDQFRYGSGVHLRRVHYQIVSQDPPVKLPSGDTYENTERCWDLLGEASKAARYLGLVDPEAFVDRRNHDPIIHVEAGPSEPPSIRLVDYTWGADSKLPSFPYLPDYELDNYVSPQKYHLEIWAEKTTMDDVLEPICEEYGANLVRGVGELSITATLSLAKRLAAAGKPARIFYISDFDPAGKSMPVAVARKLEYFLRKRGIDLDVKLFPLVLTEDQVAQYSLPRTPIKDTETRKDAFEKRFGLGATELDALEALYPGELGGIVTEALDQFYDHSLSNLVAEQQTNIESDARRVRNEVREDFAEELQELRNEYQVIGSELEAKLADHVARRTECFNRLKEAMYERLPEDLLEYYPLPEPSEAEEDQLNPLYSSDRKYMLQIISYKDFQGKSLSSEEESA